MYLAAFHGRAITPSALIAGLPLTDGRLTVQAFGRAAQRAGLEVQAEQRDINDIPSLVCPVILIMKNGGVRILSKIDHAGNTAHLVDASGASAPLDVPLTEFGNLFTGYLFLVRPTKAQDYRVSQPEGFRSGHWFWSVISRFWPNYTHVTIAAFVINILALASPLFFMSVYDRVVPNGAISSLVALSIGMLIALVFDFILRIVRSRIIDMTGKKIDVVLAANIFEHVMAIRMDQRPASAGIVASQLRDFDSVREFFTSGAAVSATDLLFALLFIGILFMISGPLALIPLLMLPIMIIVGLVLQHPLNRAMARLQAESAARHSILVETLTGMETIRASAAEARMQTLWERSVAAAARSSEDIHFWSSIIVAATNTSIQATSLLTVILGVVMILEGQLTVGTLVAATMLAGRVLSPISGIASVIARATQVFTALRAIDRIMALSRERPLDRTFVARSISSGRISFEKVTFRYPGAATDALLDVSFSIKAGERVGIIGRIGSGKTTIGKLLVGFYEPAAGRILIDGVDIRQYDPADLRRGIGLLLQDTNLFCGTIRDNITIGHPAASDSAVVAAARVSGAEDFIARHPLGYDLQIAEGGESLSGGQKQAIGLARILIRQPRVLFLDEPTAHFDVRSESELLERLKAQTSEELTLIVATHRLSLLALVDRLIVLEQGRLVADGPRDAVLNALRVNVAASDRPSSLNAAG